MIPHIKKWLLKLAPVKAWYAGRVKRHRTNQVVKTLMLAHAQELASTPGELWPIVKERQALQIMAVRDGKLDIIDRRSYQWPYLPMAIGKAQQPVIKFTPANLRKFAKTPIPRRAINLIKNSITSLDWDIVPIEGSGKVDNETAQRIKAVKNCFSHPNNTESWQIFLEEAIDDFCTMGMTYIEPQITPDVNRPFKMWTVDSSTIRIYPDWSEKTPNKPRYAQMMGLQTARGAIPFLDCELMQIKDNATVDSPFGFGKMECAFESVAHFLGIQSMSGRAGSDQVHRAWLWWERGNAHQAVEIIRRHLQNDVEGQSRINLQSGIPKPEVVEVPPVTEDELLLNWQQLLIRIIALAFDMSAVNFLERDVNRAVGEVLVDSDFRSAVVPVATKFQAAFTFFVLHGLLGYVDLKFVFTNLDDPDTSTQIQQLQALYNMSGETSNGVRAKLGLPPLATPFADLTLIETQIMMVQAQAAAQDAMAEKQFNRQQQGQMQMMQLQQEMQPAEESDGGMQSSALLPINLGKTAMYGSFLNAKQVASMTPDKLKVAMSQGLVTKDARLLAQQMEQQEPGILEQLTPALRQYIESLKDEQAKTTKGKNTKPSPSAVANQKKRYRLKRPKYSAKPNKGANNNNPGKKDV